MGPPGGGEGGRRGAGGKWGMRAHGLESPYPILSLEPPSNQFELQLRVYIFESAKKIDWWVLNKIEAENGSVAKLPPKCS